MKLEALTECEHREIWHPVLEFNFEPDGGRIFVSISHSPEICGFPMVCTSMKLITSIKGFREVK